MHYLLISVPFTENCSTTVPGGDWDVFKWKTYRSLVDMMDLRKKIIDELLRKYCGLFMGFVDNI